jgi:hypothetical protein
LSSEYTKEMDLEKENKYLIEKYSQDMTAVREEMNTQIHPWSLSE